MSCFFFSFHFYSYCFVIISSFILVWTTISSSKIFTIKNYNLFFTSLPHKFLTHSNTQLTQLEHMRVANNTFVSFRFGVPSPFINSFSYFYICQCYILHYFLVYVDVYTLCFMRVAFFYSYNRNERDQREEEEEKMNSIHYSTLIIVF